jgi:ribosome-associated heat shock protein Hsp15
VSSGLSVVNFSVVSVRIDKWLWAVRLYKTRTLAAEACKAGHVLVDDRHVKPAREVHVGEIIKAQTGEILRTVRVTGLIERRVSAPMARENAEDLTPPEELNKPRTPDYSRGIVRPKGAGRPTKRDRRKLEDLTEGAV